MLELLKKIDSKNFKLILAPRHIERTEQVMNIIKEQIKINLAERLITSSIIVDEFNIIDFSFSSAFNEAIEAKVTAEQLKLKAERDLERIKVEADQKVAEAEGKAKAIQIEAQALKANAQIVELRWIEKWDGQVPQYWGQASPFIGLNK